MLPCLRIALSPREATLKRKRQEVCRRHKMPERLCTSCVSKTRRIALWRTGVSRGEAGESFREGDWKHRSTAGDGILGRMGVV